MVFHLDECVAVFGIHGHSIDQATSAVLPALKVQSQHVLGHVANVVYVESARDWHSLYTQHGVMERTRDTQHPQTVKVFKQNTPNQP